MLLNVADFRQQARRRLPRFVFDYVDGGAEDEACMARNQRAIRELCLVPKVLRDTSRIETSIQVFGQTWRAPFAVAPMGLNGLVRPRGDLMIARAAAGAGVPFVLSTAANARLEEVAEQAGTPPWLQLYVMSDRGMAEQLLRRARRVGCGALVLTVDVPVSGFRERDVRNGFKLPFRPTLGTLLDLCSHPGWLLQVARHGAPSFVNLSETAGGGSAQQQAALLSRAMDRHLVWDSLAWLRGLWSGPLLIKGLLHPDDAARAAKLGVDGLIVSNHGGRQFDAAPATLDMLPRVVDAVEDRLPVFVDSGFRRGSDAAKALASGARAVFLGRPLLYGLAAGGETGAAAVLQLLHEELVRSMTLIGASCVADLGPGHIAPHAAAPHELVREEVL